MLGKDEKHGKHVSNLCSENSPLLPPFDYVLTAYEAFVLNQWPHSHRSSGSAFGKRHLDYCFLGT